MLLTEALTEWLAYFCADEWIHSWFAGAVKPWRYLWTIISLL